MNTSEHSLKVVHKVHVKPGIPGCCPPSDGVVPDRCAPPYGLVLSNGRYVYFVHPRTMSAVVANFTRVGNDRAERLAGKATLTSGLLLRRSEVLRSFTTCEHKAKGITPSIAWRREAWKEEALDYLPWKDERGPSSIRQTLEPFQDNV